MHIDDAFIVGDGTEIAYQVDGAAEAPVLVLSNSIATTMKMWDGVTPELARDFRVVRYDTRGHGSSGVPIGAYSLDRLGRDVVELLDALGIAQAHFCGLSLGGFVGQWLATREPDRVARLVLANTSAYLGEPGPWNEQIQRVLDGEAAAVIADRFLGNWLPTELRGDPSIVAPLREGLLSMDPHGLAGALAAVRDSDLRRTDALITSRTLVIVGEHDQVCLPAHGQLIAETIPSARLITLPVVHLSNIEAPEAFLAAVRRHLLS